MAARPFTCSLVFAGCLLAVTRTVASPNNNNKLLGQLQQVQDATRQDYRQYDDQFSSISAHYNHLKQAYNNNNNNNNNNQNGTIRVASKQPLQQAGLMAHSNPQPHPLAPPATRISSRTGQTSADNYRSQSNLNKLERYLSDKQAALVRQHPGSMMAIARAIKMTILECQHQMRNEPWDCPVHGFSTRPTKVFGKLMLRSFKETSFVHALLSAALTHSIARACTDDMIETCGLKQTRDQGSSEDVWFGFEFAKQFMQATHELTESGNSLDEQTSLARAASWYSHQSDSSPPLAATSTRQASYNNDLAGPDGVRNSVAGTAADGQAGSNGQASSSSSSSTATADPAAASLGSSSSAAMPAVTTNDESNSIEQTRPLAAPYKGDRKIRNLINNHNDGVGGFWVIEGMRRECKCYGVSGTCNMYKCWLKLPPFRSVADHIHNSYGQAIRLVSVVVGPVKSEAHYGGQKSIAPAGLRPSSTRLYGEASELAAGSLGTKSNKKRHSNQQPQQQQYPTQAGSASHDEHLSAGDSFEARQTMVSGRERPPVSIIGSRSSRGNKRHTIGLDEPDDAGHNPAGARESESSIGRFNGDARSRSITTRPPPQAPDTIQSGKNLRKSLGKLANLDSSSSSYGKISTTSNKKRNPVARSIGMTPKYIMPNQFDLLYHQNSPDFCLASESYDIKGTKGRLCSENATASNSCETLCCGRGYKTEVHEEKFNCECQFKYCCKLECKTCTRRKVIHKCL